jgi:hypothetical protein
MSGKLGVVEKGQLDLVTEGGNIGLREQQFAGPLPLVVSSSVSINFPSAPARRHVIRQSPNPIVAAKTPNSSRANRPRRPIHR